MIVATDRVEAAREMIAGHPSGEAVELDATRPADVRSAVRRGDGAISLLPVEFHPRIAEACVAERRSFVTTSYVSEEMRSLDGLARRRGLLFLSEVGADPGIDHMQAVRLVHRIQEEGGRVTGLHSRCGGLPAPEAADNPFRYKLSWSPRGVVLAGGRRARFLRKGELVPIAPYTIFDHAEEVVIDGLGPLESIPNGDSLRYLDDYDLREVDDLFRGTLRWPGWSETWSALCRLGFVDEAPDAGLRGTTWSVETWHAAGGREGEGARAAAARVLELPRDHAVLERLEWLGLFASEPVPESARTRMDLLVARMEEKLPYGPGERDLLALQHRIDFEDSEGRPGAWIASLLEYGGTNGDSAMARTVGIPAASAMRRILDGTIPERGVRIPTVPSIYEPILRDLAAAGLEEKVRETEPIA